MLRTNNILKIPTLGFTNILFLETSKAKGQMKTFSGALRRRLGSLHTVGAQ